MKGLLILGILIMTLVGALASIFLKKATNAGSFFKMLTNYNLYIGSGLYILGALINILVLKFMDYSRVLPMTSITYIWTMILSYVFLKEKINGKKIMGIISIVVGVVIVAM